MLLGENKKVMKFLALIVLGIFLVSVFSFSYVSAQSNPIVGVITNQGLNFLGMPSGTQQAINLILCAQSSGLTCVGGFVKGQIKGQLLKVVAEISPEAEQIIGLYNQVQPLIDSGKMVFEEGGEMKIDGEGNTISADGVIIEGGDDLDISNLVNKDLGEGSIKAQGISFSKEGGISRIDFTEEGGSLTIGDDKFENIASSENGESYIEMRSDGTIVGASFSTNEKGGSYNFNGLKVKAPANSHVEYVTGPFSPPTTKVSVDGEANLAKLPSFDGKGNIKDSELGNVEYDILEGKKLTLPDGTVASNGKLIFDSANPEGYIPRNSEITLNKVLVTTRNEDVFLRGNFGNDANFDYSKSALYIKDNYYQAYGNMKLNFDSPVSYGNGEIYLDGDGAYLTLDSNKITVNPWARKNGDSYLRLGNEARNFDGGSLKKLPFLEKVKLNGLPALDVDSSIQPYDFNSGNYVVGDEEIIGGVSGTSVDGDRSTLLSRAKEVISYPVSSVKKIILDIPEEVVGAEQVSKNIEEPVKPDFTINRLFEEDVNVRISSRFGYRKDPMTRRDKLHSGIDIAAPYGSKIKAFGDGEVVYSGTGNGYGNIIVIKQDDGLTTAYAHNSKNMVEVGNMVSSGDVIGMIGSEGRSTGPHVHFEIRKGSALDYQNFFDLEPVDPQGFLH